MGAGVYFLGGDILLLSLMLVLSLGVAVQIFMKRLPLPGLLGLLFLGVALGPYGLNLLDETLLAGAQDLRMLALIIILLKAGLGLNRQVLNEVKGPAFGMGVVPCLAEGLAVTLAAVYILDFSWPVAASLGFVLAAVSPAVVVPSILFLRERGLGMNKGIPVLILAGASVDDVVAITLLTSALGWAVAGTVAGLWWQALLIPARILAGVALGLLVGFLLARLLPKVAAFNRGYTALAVFAGALAVVALGEHTGIAGLLAVMACGFMLVERAGRDELHMVVRATDAAWLVAQIFLFVLIGAAVDIGVALEAGLAGVAVITLGLIGRSVGVLGGLLGSKLNWRERVFCIIAYLPKATVQAAVGGLPLAMGIAGGEIILAIAVLSIILTAPLGAVAIPLAAHRLLVAEEIETG